jgi:hypothetical protein
LACHVAQAMARETAESIFRATQDGEEDAALREELAHLESYIRLAEYHAAAAMLGKDAPKGSH